MRKVFSFHLNKKMSFIIGVLSLCLVGAAPLSADSIYISGTFRTTNQSMWGGGGALVADYSIHPQILSTARSQEVGAIGCFLGLCAGASVGGNLTANLGLNLGAYANAGSVSAVSPFGATINYAGVAAAGSSIQPTLSWDFDQGTLTTVAPTVRLYAEFDVDLNGLLYGQGCFGGCTNYSQNVAVSSTTELLALNRDNDGELRILGAPVAPLHGSSPGGATWDINFPGAATGTGTDMLNAAVSTDVAHLLLPSGVGNSFAGPSNGFDLGWVSYTVIKEATSTEDVYFNQEFHLQMQPTAVLHVQETGQDVPCLLFACGSIQIPATGDTLTVIPSFTGGGYFTNTTGVQFVHDYDISLLEASIFGLRFGPLIDAHDTVGFSQNLFSSAFPLQGFNTVNGPSFTIQIDSGNSVPEPASLVLLGSGILGLGILRRRQSKG